MRAGGGRDEMMAGVTRRRNATRRPLPGRRALAASSLPRFRVSIPAMAQRPPIDAGTDATKTLPMGEALRGGDGLRISIVVYHGGGAEIALLTADRPVIVGRAHPADLIIADRTLSREHARFSLQDDHILVEDLGSTNGCWLAGKRVKGATLGVGGEVMLGAVLVCVHALGALDGDPVGPERPPSPLSGRPPSGRPTPPTPAPRPEGGAPGSQGALVTGAAMRELLETVSRVSASRLPILLHGETGTGKEVLARLIHDSGPRRERRMVCVNCAAIPAQLVESALFGHEKGAFTGAVLQQKGVFEEANKGTVLLDEIGELPAAAQAALLRVLETMTFSRVGSTRLIEVDVRVIAATHRDLVTMVEAGEFRADLYYRLNALTLAVPPLRRRVDEIEPLARSFLEQANAANGWAVRGISPDALAALRAYAWPGNVRELKNVIERAVVVAQTEAIRAEDLLAEVQAARRAHLWGSGASDPTDPDASAMTPPGGLGELRPKLQEYEAQLITKTLATVAYSRADAARLLGMPLRTLAHKIKALGIKEPPKEPPR